MDVAHRAVVRHAAGRADACTVLLRRGLAFSELQVWTDRDVAVVGKPARNLLVRSIPARHVVNDDHARMTPGTERSREVGVDLVTLVPAHVDGFGKLRLVGHGALPL